MQGSVSKFQDYRIKGGQEGFKEGKVVKEKLNQQNQHGGRST
jgi:hypothetical protein